ncbi:MAG: hypothetical protein KVP17_003615 [Porospora cf. gigantea B]|uniref:uncharacterized protein n=1 Tax=Porospora cf. gigantea B TaxID=2853592 RepID=UPI00357195E4|nr:MAG: hypothetical protein KVP17_003615 [Porospora cf. gigantea B]
MTVFSYVADGDLQCSPGSDFPVVCLLLGRYDDLLYSSVVQDPAELDDCKIFSEWKEMRFAKDFYRHRVDNQLTNFDALTIHTQSRRKTIMVAALNARTQQVAFLLAKTVVAGGTTTLSRLTQVMRCEILVVGNQFRTRRVCRRLRARRTPLLASFGS